MDVKIRPVELIEKPITDIVGIENIKELVKPVCGLINAAVNEKGLGSYLSIVPDLPAAIIGIGEVDDEFVDMTEEEYNELVDFIKQELDFEGDANAIEKIVEDITKYVLGIIHCIVRLKNAKE